MNIFKVILVIFGTISLGIGLIGIIVPGLPTTPFLLLTAGLYVRSSEKWYQKLISIPFLGSYILNLRAKRGMTVKVKLFAIGIMWLMILLSSLYFIEAVEYKLLVTTIGIIGTLVMGFIVPTDSDSSETL